MRRKVLDIYPKRELYFASFLCLRVDQKNNSALASISLIYNKMSKRGRAGGLHHNCRPPNCCCVCLTTGDSQHPLNVSLFVSCFISHITMQGEEDEERRAVHHPAETTQHYSKEFFRSPMKTSAKTSEFIVEGFVITDLSIGTIS